MAQTHSHPEQSVCRMTLKRPRDESTDNDNDTSGRTRGTHRHAHSHKKIRCIMSELPERMRTTPPDCECSPDTTVKQLNPNSVYHTYAFLCESNFFHAPTEEEIAAYDSTVLTAVRTEDYATLRALRAAGRPLKCSNAFGESLLHLACRKGMEPMTRFLVHEAKVPLQICDDFGRTPLHDACWAVEPNFALIDLLLGECPDLLYAQDRRGSTPLQYVRRPQWKHWNAYLKSKGVDFLTARLILS
jgi:Ankyrin repeats (3 copies)